MNSSPEIHALIRATTKAERRRFVLACGEEANYARLFQVIASQEVYDEAAIKSQFKGEAFIRNFSVAKAYLYARVLHVLRTAHAPLNIEMALRRTLDDLEILHAKGLYSQAEKALASGLSLARMHDLPAQEAELLKWRRRLINILPGKGRLNSLGIVDQEETDALQRTATETTLRALRAQVQSIALDQIDLRLAENADRLKAIVVHPVLLAAPDGLRFHARTAYHQVHAAIARLHADTNAVIHHLRATLQAWQAAPVHQKEHPHQYLNAMAAFLDACIRAHLFDGFHETLASLHALPQPDAQLRAQAFYLGHHLELRHAISTGDFDSGIRLSIPIEQGLLQHVKFLNPGIPLTFLYNLAVVHFLAWDFSTTLKYVNRILNQSQPSVRQDIFDATRLIELATHFSLGNLDLLESLQRSMARRLRLHPRAHAFEKVVVQGIGRLLDVPRGQTARAFEEIHAELDAVDGAAFLAGREEILLWLRANMEGTKPADLIRAAGR